MAQAGCPDVRNWQALLEECVSGDESPDLVVHLETCAACQQTLEILAADRGVWESIPFGLVRPARSEPALRSLVDSLKNEEPLPSEEEDFPYLRPSDRPGLLGLLGDYEVQEVIGRGGMAVVFKAVDPALHRPVAIKVMTSAAAGSPGARQRFAREARAAAAVCHENIVAVHGVHEADGLPYLVMQHVAGESLQARLDRDGPLELEEIVRIGLQTAQGLAAAHAQGLIHRDIKPANLLLQKDEVGRNQAKEEGGRMKNEQSKDASDASFLLPPSSFQVKITDFGLARMTDDVQLTQNGVVAGTPAYMSPEQARGEAIDHRADLFSLGSVLYALCTGVPPFRGSTPLAVLRQVSDEVPAPMGEWNPRIPDWLEALVDRLMAKDPAERFQSVVEVAALLEGYLAHLRQPTTVAAPQLPAADRAPSLPEPGMLLEVIDHSRSRLFLGMLVTLVLVGLVVARWLSGAGGEVEAKREYKEQYYLSLQGKPEVSDRFELFGPDAERCVCYEPAGLRLSLPRGFPDQRPGTGLTIPVTAKGNFEITVGFEILQEPQPAEAGRQQTLFAMDAVLDAPGNTAATISRKIDPRMGSQFLAWMTVWDEAAQKDQTRGKGFPTRTKSGQLRLVRTDSTLAYYASEAPNGEFVFLTRFPFAKGDVQAVRLIGSTGGAQAALDVRVTDLRIRSETLQGLPAEKVTSDPASTVTSPREQSRGWLAAGGIIGLLMAGTVLIGVWMYLRRRQRAGKVSAEGHISLKGGKPDVSTTSVSLRCSGCRKTLRGKPELAGKKVRCPHCGTVATAPPPGTGDGPAVSQRIAGPNTRLRKWQMISAAGLALLLLAGGLVLGLHQRKREPMVDVPVGAEFASEVDEAGFYGQHFDMVGQPFRWTDGNARLVIPFDPNKPPHALRLHLFPWRPEQVKQVRLKITVNRRELFDEQVSTDHWEQTLNLEGINLGDKVVLEIGSDTFVPKEFAGGSPDDRQLGVQVRAVKLLAATDPARLLDVPLGREYVFGVKESGFRQSQFDKEGNPFRWTDGSARLTIPLDRQKLPRALRLHLWPWRPAQIKQVWVRIVVNGRALFNGQVKRADAWKRTFDLAGIDLGEELVLEIVSDTFVPRDHDRGADRRALGVEVKEITLITPAK